MNDFIFKVEWKLPRKKPDKGDYIFPSPVELLRSLARTEGVTKDSVEYLVIHQMIPGGRVAVICDIDNRNKSTALVPVGNVIPITAAKIAKKDKPRVKLKSSDLEPLKITANYGLYVATPA